MTSKPNPFRFEIGIVLIVKLILIFSLKALFFSNPVDRNLTGQDIAGHLLGSEPPSAAPRFTP